VQELGHQATTSVNVGIAWNYVGGRAKKRRGRGSIVNPLSLLGWHRPVLARVDGADSSAEITTVHVSPEDHIESLFQAFEGDRQQV
jgi:hypothetical protein